MGASTAINSVGFAPERFEPAPIATYLFSQPLASSAGTMTPPAGATFLRYSADNNSFLMIGSTAFIATSQATGGSSAPAPELYFAAHGPIYRHIGKSTAISWLSTATLTSHQLTFYSV